MLRSSNIMALRFYSSIHNLFLVDGNAEYIVSEQILTQQQAQEYCSKHNGTLLYFQWTVNIKLQKGGPYWAGLVYNEVTKKYECSGDFLIKSVVNKQNGDKCVIAKMKENNKPLVLHSSWCCGNLAYAICKSQKDGVAIDTGNYCYFFLKLFISLYSVIAY